MRAMFFVPFLTLISACTSMSASDRQAEMQVDRLMAAYSGERVPGAAVMVVRKGQTILAKTYGLANVAEKTRVVPATNFRLASITKQFTATAVLQLVQAGKLALDDSIRTHLPELGAYAQAITIRHLLQHTSGIEDYEPLYGDRFPEQIDDNGVVALMASRQTTNFDPGSQYSYSNTGYAILAVLVERLSGQSFPDYLQEHIFAPLGMGNTVAYVACKTSIPNRSLGYRVEGADIQFADQSAWSAVLGDGGVYSSIIDLKKWDQALYEGGLLRSDLRDLSLTPGLENYGFGFRIDEFAGHKRVHHSGSTSGFRNHMVRFPELQLSVVVLTNRAGPDVAPLADRIASLYLDES